MSETTTDRPGREAPGSDSAYLPLLMLSVTLLASVALQSYSLWSERQNYARALTNQAEPLAEAQKTRQQLESIAVGAADLAVTGNANAQRLLDELSKLGVSVTPSIGTQ